VHGIEREALACRKQNPFIVHGTVEDVQNVDRISAHNIENSVISMDGPFDAGFLMTGKQRAGLREIPDRLATSFQLFREGESPLRIIFGNVIADNDQVSAGLLGEDDLHRPRSFAMLA
jgi:hypothetical protein